MGIFWGDALYLVVDLTTEADKRYVNYVCFTLSVTRKRRKHCHKPRLTDFSVTGVMFS